MSAPPDQPSPASSALGQLWKSATTNPVPMPPWPSALRRGLIVAAIVAIGASTGYFSEAGTIAIGAMMVGFVDGPVPRRTLAGALLLVTVVITVVVFFSTLAAQTWWALPLLAVLALIYGTIAASGMITFAASMMSLIVAIVFSNIHGDITVAAQTALYLLIGCLIQGAVSLIAWHYEREAAIRRAVRLAVRSLGDFVVTEEGTGDAQLAAVSAQMNAERMLGAARLEHPRHEPYANLLVVLNWTRLCASNWLSVGDPTPKQRQAVAEALNGIAAEIGQQHHLLPESARTQLDSAGNQPWQDLVDRVHRLQTAGNDFAEAGLTAEDGGAATRRTGDSIAQRADRIYTPRQRLGALAVLFRPSSPMFHHGVQLAAAVGIAEAIVLIFHIDHGSWVVITVALLIKPDFATTIVRGALRIVGTIAAVIVIGGLLELTGNPQWLMVALLVVIAPLVMRWLATANYGLAAFAITALVLILMEAAQPSLDTALDRLVNTLIGTVIAVVVYLLWPSWSGDRLPALLANVVRAQQAWTNAVLSSLSRPDTADLPNLRRLALASRNAVILARPAAQAAVIEPHHSDSDPNAAQALLEACIHAASATLALEFEAWQSSQPGNTAAPITLDASKLEDQVNADFSEAMAALGHTEPGTQPVVPSPATSPESLGLTPTGDVVTDRALGLLIAATDSIAVAARLV